MANLFQLGACPGPDALTVRPRPYQQEALEALDSHLRLKETNPCVVLPTGSGKSLQMAWTLLRFKADYPPFRAGILAHRKELVAQNAEELHKLWPTGNIGVYSAGLGRRDVDNSIIYASIDSVYNRWGHFPPFDLLLIDEAHRIPARGEGKYRQFIAGCKSQNPQLRVAGFTATPTRLGMGPICHRDHILQEICYEAHVDVLIRDGYLCPLRSRIGASPDLAAVKRSGAGDYQQKSLAATVDAPDVVKEAVSEIASVINVDGRRSVILFCIDVKHCKAVSAELGKWGIVAPIVTGATPGGERDRVLNGFIAGHYRAVVNCNVLTEGFNARQVDCVVLLRPTLSSSLYAQMVGRGLRTHPGKSDCLVLDYARCIETHGPIDCLDPGEAKIIVCGSVLGAPDGSPQGCGDAFSRALRTCPHCGWDIPPQEVVREAEVERVRQMHERRAAQAAILGREPETLEVSAVTVHHHKAPNGDDSMRVQYRCGLRTFREWVCLGRDGYAGKRAHDWWARRFGRAEAVSMTVEKAVEDLFTASRIKAVTQSITVVRSGKYYEILSHSLQEEHIGGR